MLSMIDRGVLLIGPRSLEDSAAKQVREQTRWFIELNKRRCSFILLPDLPGTSPEVCNALPDWLEVILLTPERWVRTPRWEDKRYDNVLELPMRRGYGYATSMGDNDYFARRSYRFGIDWVMPSGGLLVFRNEKLDPVIEGGIQYAKTQQVPIYTRNI